VTPRTSGPPGYARRAWAAANALRARAAVALAPRAALAYLFAIALLERIWATARRSRARRPRLVWGPVPIISLKYWSEAMRGAGYESRTCVLLHYPAHTRADFDVYLDEFASGGPLAAQLAPYRFYAWALRHGDVFIRFLDGGFLRYTSADRHELRILRLAGKRLIVSPFGGDVAVEGHFGGLEEALYADYPALRGQSTEIAARVDHTVRWADLVIRNWQVGYLPRHDVVWLNQLAIDLERWAPAGQDSGADGRDGEVAVLHIPNHRHIKGTSYLEEAVRELREEGLSIDLSVMQGRPNEEIRKAVLEADIVADQFLLPGYAMAAVEAMAQGKPVMVSMGNLHEELKATEAFERCPAVDTNPETLKENLRRLVLDPGLRRELGAAGREFVERFHSYPVVAEGWERLLAHAWGGEPLPDSMLPRGAEPGISRAVARGD
jgi:glycosyltransferase involved in cell wall biosynthesis